MELKRIAANVITIELTHSCPPCKEWGGKKKKKEEKKEIKQTRKKREGGRRRGVEAKNNEKEK